MAQNAKVSIIITAKDMTARAFNSAKLQVASLAAESKEMLGSLQGGLATLGFGLVAAQVTHFLIDTNKETQTLKANLETMTGSAENANAVFNDIAKMAAETPFQVGNLAEAFTTLASAGITPSIQTLKEFGDLAASRGKDITDLAEAVRGGLTGEMERLKQFGVTAQVNGDKLTMGFKGQTTVIGKNAKELTNYLTELSRNNYSGAMARQMNTIGGAFSNLQDAVQQAARRIGEAGMNDLIQKLAVKVTSWAEKTATDTTEIRVHWMQFSRFWAQLWEGIQIAALTVIALVQAPLGALTLVIGAFGAAFMQVLIGIADAANVMERKLVGAENVVRRFLHLKENSAALFDTSQARQAKATLEAGAETGGTMMVDAFGNVVNAARKSGENQAAFEARIADVRKNQGARDKARAAKGKGLNATGDTIVGGNGDPKLAAEAEKKAITERIDAEVHLSQLEATRVEGVRRLKVEEAALTRELKAGKGSWEHRADVAERLKKVQDALTEAIKAGNDATAKQLEQLTETPALGLSLADTLNALQFMERGLAKAVSDGNVPLADRIEKWKLLKKVRDEIAARDPERDARTAAFLDAGRPDNMVIGTNAQTGDSELKSDGTKGTDLGNQVTAQTKALLDEMRDPHYFDAVLEGIAQMRYGVANLNADLSDIATAGIGGFASAATDAFMAFATGAHVSAAAFKKAFVGAIADAAKAKGEFYLAEGLGALAAGIMGHPGGGPGAAFYFKAAAAMFAVAGIAGRIAGGGGSGGGSSNSAADDARNSKLEQEAASITIMGGLLDMSDPRQSDALAQALEKLSGRRVNIVAG